MAWIDEDAKASVKSFAELYILVGKLIKIIQYKNKSARWIITTELEMVKLKCMSEIKSSLGKLLLLPDLVVDKVFGYMISDTNFDEDYQFEEVDAEKIGILNMMYGRLASIYQNLRDADQHQYVRFGAYKEFWRTPSSTEKEDLVAVCEGLAGEKELEVGVKNVELNADGDDE